MSAGPGLLPEGLLGGERVCPPRLSTSASGSIPLEEELPDSLCWEGEQRSGGQSACGSAPRALKTRGPAAASVCDRAGAGPWLLFAVGSGGSGVRGSGESSYLGGTGSLSLGSSFRSSASSPHPMESSSEQPQHPQTVSADRLSRQAAPGWWGGARPPVLSGPFLAQLTQPRPVQAPPSAEHCPADPGPSLGPAPPEDSSAHPHHVLGEALAFLFRCSLWDTPTSACFLSLWGGGQPLHVKEPLPPLWSASTRSAPGASQMLSDDQMNVRNPASS